MGPVVMSLRVGEVHAVAISQFHVQRFWAKVDKTETCWIWTGSLNASGYGCVRIEGRSLRPHRVSYALEFGEIPAGLTLDHLCRVRSCVRPDHLEAVTHRENSRRGTSGDLLRARLLAKTSCRNGHPYGPDTPRRKEGCRNCAVCKAEGSKRRERNRRERARAAEAAIDGRAH